MSLNTHKLSSHSFAIVIKLNSFKGNNLKLNSFKDEIMSKITISLYATLISLTVSLTLSLTTPLNAAELIKKSSPHTVEKTVTQLKAAITKAGATLFAKIDHAAGAKKVGKTLRPTTLIIFGNPKLGTPAMTLAQTAGLDLPLRVLIFEDNQGKTHLVYHAPKQLSTSHGIPKDAEVLVKMTGALNKLTNAAIK